MLTPEREKKLREYINSGLCIYPLMAHEFLDEIDRLRSENQKTRACTVHPDYAKLDTILVELHEHRRAMEPAMEPGSYRVEREMEDTTETIYIGTSITGLLESVLNHYRQVTGQPVNRSLQEELPSNLSATNKPTNSENPPKCAAFSKVPASAISPKATTASTPSPAWWHEAALHRPLRTSRASR